MDRKTLVELFRKGMSYPPGKHRFWIWRCFEITVHADPHHSVEIDEDEGFEATDGSPSKKSPGHSGNGKDPKKMFHVGRTILHPEDGQAVEEAGTGWNGNGDD